MIKQIYSVIAISGVLLLMLSIFNSCKQEETFAKATIETSQVTSVTEATATCGGIISADGGSDVTARGVCWSTSPNPTIENNTTIDAVGTGPFTSLIKELSPSTTYYVRGYATNSVGTSYGNEVSFTTLSDVILLTTNATSLITTYTATSGGTITSDGGAPVTERGVCWDTTPSPTTANNKYASGSGTGTFISNITGLTLGTTYFIRSYATNSIGTVYGNEVSFTTLSGVILLTTNATSLITAYTATSGGTITSDGGASVTERGVCWNTSPSPSTANNKTASGGSTGFYTCSITGLIANTTYYVRAWATNSVGTGYGNEVTFKTYGVSDIDGNVYHTVTIGTQVWMAENLKTTKYNDGTSIPLVNDGTDWSALTTPGYCFYNNEAANKSTYGALYNWYTVNTGKLAPTGWHVPTDAEWTTLENYLVANGYNYDGTTTGNKIAKSLAATTLWRTYTGVGAIGNDLTKNNTSGFTALPGGCRYKLGTFYQIDFLGYWWSSTEYSTTYAWYRHLNYYDDTLSRFNYPKSYGYSVRCVKD